MKKETEIQRIRKQYLKEIVEKGTFQELMQKKGFFYSLYVVSKE